MSIAKEEKLKTSHHYDLIIVGSGMQMGKWTGEAEDFLKRFQKDLAQKKFAIFVSTMKTVLLSEKEKPSDLEKDRKMELEDKIAKYNLKPD